MDQPLRRIIPSTPLSPTFLFLTLTLTLTLHLATGSPQKPDPNVIRVNKCCEKFEVLVDKQCTHVNQTGLPHMSK